MPELNEVEDTLFVPMLGRIYATENFPSILNDRKAIELKSKLPENIKGQDTQTQYTLIASATRSANTDRYVREFEEKHADGIIVEFGCGLETGFYRNEDGHEWYEVDLPDVIEYRRTLLGEPEHCHLIAADGFTNVWIEEIRKDHPDAPVLVTVSGVFLYFPTEKIVELFNMLKGYGHVEVVFDTLSEFGMKRLSKYMKQVGHGDVARYFYVEDAVEFAKLADVKLLRDEDYYSHISTDGMKFMTRMTIKVADKKRVVKMIHVSMN